MVNIKIITEQVKLIKELEEQNKKAVEKLEEAFSYKPKDDFQKMFGDVK